MGFQFPILQRYSLPLPLGHEIFAKVEEEFILDESNLKGIEKYVTNLRRAIFCILNMENSDNDEMPVESTQDIKKSAEITYGLIHARYIQTPKGMKQMSSRYKKGVFGSCPRVLCEHQSLLPFGQSESPGVSPVSFYCPRCQDLYASQKARYAGIDGAFFGPNFAHMFVVNHPLQFIKPKQDFLGTLFGFKVHKSSDNHPPRILFDPVTGKTRVMPRSTIQFVDPLTVMKMPRKFLMDVKPSSDK